MAASGASAGSSPEVGSSFAVVCSFLERYGSALDLPAMTFLQMEKYLEQTSSVPPALVELHVKLLRKLGKSVTAEKWEKYLIKICQEVNSTWSWEMERKGYAEITMQLKADILKHLCESQFDDNLKFKTLVNEEDPEQMRLQPLGKDQDGLLYWFQQDQEQNIRLYIEEQDDLDGSSWRCIARTRTELVNILKKLQSKMEPETKKEEPDQGRAADSGDEGKSKSKVKAVERADKVDSVSKQEDKSTVTINFNLDKVLKTETEPAFVSIKKEKSDELSELAQDQKKMLVPTEAPRSDQTSVIDNRVSTIKSLVKEEPRASPQHWNAISVVRTPCATNQAKTEARERSMKSDQQAKIPLKKRELKSSNDFSDQYSPINQHNNSNGNMSTGGIIVCNPAVSEQKKSEPLPKHMKLTSSPGKALPVDLNKKVSFGVIMGPIEKKREPHETLTKDRNGLHGDDVILKTEVTENIRQSVLVTKPGLTQDTSHNEHTKSDGTTNSRDTLLQCGDERSWLRADTDGKDHQEILASSKPQPSHAGEMAGKRKVEDTGHATTSLKPPEESRRFKRKKRSEKSKLKMHSGEDEEVSSELQEEGIRLKIKIPLHRRTPKLRRSARICKPSPKLAEIQERKHTSHEEEKKKDLMKKKRSDGLIKSGRSKRRHKRPCWTKPAKPRKMVLTAQEDGLCESKSGQEDEKIESELDLFYVALPEDSCKRCGLPNHPELILLCDLCDSGYHTACLRPPLMIIPDGQWFCPPCQHKLLCQKLEKQLQNLDAALKKRERAERRRERLVYVGISVENIIPNPDADAEEEKPVKTKGAKKSKNLERRSTRNRKSISYRFDDFDEAIDEAIEEDFQNSEVEAVDGSRNMATDTGQQEKATPKETRQSVRMSTPRKRHRRLNDLDSDSTPDEEESEDEDEFQLSESLEEEEEFAVSDDAGSDADAASWEGSECGSYASSGDPPAPPKRISGRGRAQRGRGSTRRIVKRHRRSSEEEEEEMETDGSSEGSDSDVNLSRRRSRRNRKALINYCETSESEGHQASEPKTNQPIRRHRPSNSNPSAPSKDSEQEAEPDSRSKRCGRKRRSMIKNSKQRHKQMKQVKSSSEAEEESDEAGSNGAPNEEGRLLRKRPNRIETDEEAEDEEEVQSRSSRQRSSRLTDLRQQRTRASTRGSTLKHNGLHPTRPPAQDEDEEEEEEDLSAATDFVNFVFDSKQLS